MNHKKSLVDAEASPSIHASIHRSLVSPTALVSILHLFNIFLEGFLNICLLVCGLEIR
jgi:hypothetical protein